MQKLKEAMAPAPKRLRDLIRDIRTAKTNAEERAIINKECADIRNSFRDEDSAYRCRNMAKALYIYMLGYPAHFGQLECMKLIASPRFSDKRIGYLGAMLLLDERAEVHILVTNCLKSDLSHQTQYVVALALCCLGNICSPEMGRDLASDVEKHIKSTNAYLKKKAILCAAKIIHKVPELMETFLPSTRSLLSEKTHGVLHAACILIADMCKLSVDMRKHFRKSVPSLMRLLKNLIISGQSPEHDVSGISDPFLQVKVLHLLHILGEHDDETSDMMNDMLAQVATNTDGGKNVGNAILYETCLTIMAVKCEPALRVLAVNILGRFLLNTDKNIRYVALSTLLKVVNIDGNAVQRHRATVVECLGDVDITIKRRAMELCFAMTDGSNVRIMVKELLAFLETCDIEFKGNCSFGIMRVVERYAPDAQWHIDAILQVLVAAGNFVRDDVVCGLAQLVACSPDQHGYAAHRLYTEMSQCMSAEDCGSNRQPLLQVACWCVGEFGDLLLLTVPAAQSSSGRPFAQPTEAEVVNILEKVLTSSLSSVITKEYALTAFVKLTARFSSSVIVRIRNILAPYGCSTNVELQQRASEFSQFFGKHDGIRSALLERMPPPEVKAAANGAASAAGSVERASAQQLPEPVSASSAKEATPNIFDLLDLTPSSADVGGPAASTLSNGDVAAVKGSATSDLLDILGALDGHGVHQASVPSQPAARGGFIAAPAGGAGDLDLLGGFGMTGLAAASPAAGLLLMDGIGGSAPSGSLSMMQGQQQSGPPHIIAFEKNGLTIRFDFDRDPASTSCTIRVTATNAAPLPITDFVFQAAVPKTFQLILMSPSTSQLPAYGAGCMTQAMKVVNATKQPLRMRLRMTYALNGVPVLEQGEVNNFPEETWR